MRGWGLLAALALGACQRAAGDRESSVLLSQVRAGLAERERKVQSYRFNGAVRDVATGKVANYRFVYRSPQKLRGELGIPSNKLLCFDGRSLYESDSARAHVTRVDFEGVPAAQVDGSLHQLFAPLSPEGYRAPLIPSGATAEPGPRDSSGKETVIVSVRAGDEGQEALIRYRFRAPAMDLLDRTTEGADAASEQKVIEEHCEATLGLCFPKAIEERAQGQLQTAIALDQISVNSPAAPELFSLSPAPGGKLELKTASPQRANAR